MVKHVLKNGQVVQDITGHVIKRKDFPSVYELMERKEKRDGNIRTNQKSQ
jgi:hypothetical protein